MGSWDDGMSQMIDDGVSQQIFDNQSHTVHVWKIYLHVLCTISLSHVFG